MLLDVMSCYVLLLSKISKDFCARIHTFPNVRYSWKWIFVQNLKISWNCSIQQIHVIMVVYFQLLDLWNVVSMQSLLKCCDLRMLGFLSVKRNRLTQILLHTSRIAVMSYLGGIWFLVHVFGNSGPEFIHQIANILWDKYVNEQSVPEQDIHARAVRSYV